MNSIYAKTVHKENSTPHELHLITSSRHLTRTLTSELACLSPH